MPDKSVDLVVTDPPYQIDNTVPGGGSDLAKSFKLMNDDIVSWNLTKGFDVAIFDELCRVMKKINIYFWCNGKQLPMYLDYWVTKKKASLDVLIWNKTNPCPLFSNKYLSDKEYCLFFRKGAYCKPKTFEQAKTVYYQPMNTKDKRKYGGFPTVKPLNIIRNLVENSSKEGETVLDPFMGTGTTGVACKELNRKFIGMEINEKAFSIAKKRLGVTK